MCMLHTTVMARHAFDLLLIYFPADDLIYNNIVWHAFGPNFPLHYKNQIPSGEFRLKSLCEHLVSAALHFE